MLPDILLKIFEGAGHFSPLFKSELEEKIHAQFYQGKQIIQAAGQIETSLYLLESGFARSYYYDRNGHDHTVNFWTAGELIFSYEGYYHVPSFHYTEFLINSKAIALSYHDLGELEKIFDETSGLIKSTLLKNRRQEYERQYILSLAARERYLKLLEQNPIIFQKSPAKYIASYLNMTRETLARLMGKR